MDASGWFSIVFQAGWIAALAGAPKNRLDAPGRCSCVGGQAQPKHSHKYACLVSIFVADSLAPRMF